MRRAGMSTRGRPLHVIIACGGTGGHLFPGIAVAQVLRARGHEVLLLISEKQFESGKYQNGSKNVE